MYEKYENLKKCIKKLGTAAVAFSGGTDSALLLKTAHDVLGDGCVAITVRSQSFPERELSAAYVFCRSEGIRHTVIDFDELEIEGFCANPKNRCYLCKTGIFRQMRKAVNSLGIDNILEGSNTDDEGDYRPGLIAVKEQGVLSPLRDVGLCKAEIRQLSKELGLPTWDKPSLACLSSRFPYGEEITSKKLSMVDKAEQFLLELGFRQVRVRIHGMMARIEIERSEFSKLVGEADKVYSYLKNLGFTYVSLDLCGYRTGSMNEVL